MSIFFPLCMWLVFVSLFSFALLCLKTGSYFVGQAGLEQVILLTRLFEWCYHRHKPLDHILFCFVLFRFGLIETRSAM